MSPPKPRRGRPSKPGSVSHSRRIRFAEGARLRVKLRLANGRKTMRDARMRKLVGECVDAANGRFGTKILGCWGEDTSILLVVESDGCEALASAMQGLSVRIAKRVNRTFGTRGAVFGQRYDAIVLVKLRRMKRAERVLRKVNYHLFNLRDFLHHDGYDTEGAAERATTGPPIRTFLELALETPLAFRAPLTRIHRGEKREAILRRERQMMQRLRDSRPMKRRRR